MSEIIGHAAILSAFDRLAAAERLAHAYLLTGPSGVGKTVVAEWLAARLLCSASHGQPCGQCVACAAVARGAHPDVLRLRGEDVRTVERVREWTASLARSALFAGWKVGIVEGADQMNEASANACLKSIEEPTPKTVVLLTAPSRRAVLPTIASRCCLIACNRVHTTELARALQDRGVTNAEAEEIAESAGGCPGKALALSGDAAARAAHTERLALARSMVSGSCTERFRHVESFVRGLPDVRSDATARVVELVGEFRALARTEAHARRSSPDWVAWQQLLIRAPQDLAANVSPRLLLETIVLTHPMTV